METWGRHGSLTPVRGHPPRRAARARQGAGRTPWIVLVTVVLLLGTLWLLGLAIQLFGVG